MNSEKVFIGDIKRCIDYTMESMFICEDSLEFLLLEP